MVYSAVRYSPLGCSTMASLFLGKPLSPKLRLLSSPADPVIAYIGTECKPQGWRAEDLLLLLDEVFVRSRVETILPLPICRLV